MPAAHILVIENDRAVQQLIALNLGMAYPCKNNTMQYAASP